MVVDADAEAAAGDADPLVEALDIRLVVAMKLVLVDMVVVVEDEFDTVDEFDMVTEAVTEAVIDEVVDTVIAARFADPPPTVENAVH